jgi:lipid-A-disaccharide synthase
MKYYIISGEASGDLHGSNLVMELKTKDPEAEIRAWGGDKMKDAGASIVKHYKDLAFMGFAEVLSNIKTILNNIKFCKKDILQFQPDAIIFIDYPGFNLRIAKWAHEQNFKTIYYISPQLWAWHASRAKQIKKHIDKMLVILPFEKDFYKKWNYEVEFVGHPLLDAINQEQTEDQFYEKNGLNEKHIIAILPGSRRQEIKRMLPIMVSISDQYPDYQFVVSGISQVEKSLYQPAIDKTLNIVFDQTYTLLQHAHAALVTSGTATLETALFEVPQVVCYKGGFVSYFIGKRLVDVPYISLVNLVLQEEVVKELIQNELTESNLKDALNKILDDKIRETCIEKYKQLKNLLGGPGASSRTAGAIIKYLHDN